MLLTFASASAKQVLCIFNQKGKMKSQGTGDFAPSRGSIFQFLRHASFRSEVPWFLRPPCARTTTCALILALIGLGLVFAPEKKPGKNREFPSAVPGGALKLFFQ